MQLIRAFFMGVLLLALAAVGTAFAQGTIHVTFDGPPVYPPGTQSTGWNIYSESAVGVHPSGSGDGFTRTWSGASLFPDNGTAYLQAGRAGLMYFDYYGSSTRFNAISVDLALYSTSSLDPVAVQFIAGGYSSTIATTQFTITGAVDGQGRPLFQTFYFPPEFLGMHYLYVMPMDRLWSLDNLVISRIPETSTIALLLGGALMLAGHWLRRFRGRG
jgi:hypothetical protein